MSPVGIYAGGVVELSAPSAVADNGTGGTGGGVTGVTGTKGDPTVIAPMASGERHLGGRAQRGIALGGGAGAPSLAASLLALLGLAVARRRR